MRFINAVLRTAIFLVIAYLAVTAYFGFRVGREIEKAKTKNVLVNVAADLGRAYVEQAAVKVANLPAYVTDSPTFWWAMRATE